jgi:hypothetical protein
VISNVRSYDALSTPIPAWWFELAMLQAVLAVGSLYMLGNASPTGDGRSYAEGVMLCLTQAGYLRACSDAGVEALVREPFDLRCGLTAAIARSLLHVCPVGLRTGI